MKLFNLLVLLALCSLCSCGKARDLIAKLGDKLEDAPSSEFIHEISEKDYQSFTQQADALVVIDFHSDLCPPCLQLFPMLKTIAKEHKGTVLVGKVNVDKAKELAAREGVRGIPDVRLFRNDKQVDQFVGLPPESEVRRLIDNQLKDLPKAAEETVDKDGKPVKKEPTIRPMEKDWLPKGIERK